MPRTRLCTKLLRLLLPCDIIAPELNRHMLSFSLVLASLLSSRPASSSAVSISCYRICDERQGQAFVLTCCSIVQYGVLWLALRETCKKAPRLSGEKVHNAMLKPNTHERIPCRGAIDKLHAPKRGECASKKRAGCKIIFP